MRLHLVMFIVINVRALAIRPKFEIKQRLRDLRGYVDEMKISKEDCQHYCTTIHGYFEDLDGKTQPASVGEGYWVRCQCMVSQELRDLIEKTLGPQEARQYRIMNFIGQTQKGRARVVRLARDKKITIKFLAFNEPELLAQAERAKELSRQLSEAKRATLARQISGANKIAELQGQVQALQRDADQLRIKVAHPSGKEGTLSRQNSGARMEAEEHARQLSDARREIDALKKQLLASRKEAADLRRELNDSRSEVKQLREQLSQKEKEVADTQRHLAESREEAARLRAQLSEMEKEALKLKKVLTTTKRVFGDLKNKLLKKGSAVKVTEAQLKEVQQRADNFHKQLIKSNNQSAELERELSDLTMELADIKEQLRQERNKTGQLRWELEESRKETEAIREEWWKVSNQVASFQVIQNDAIRTTARPDKKVRSAEDISRFLESI